MAVAAMVDRLVHHAEVIVLKGESYRLKGKGKEVMGSESTRALERAVFNRRLPRSFQPALTRRWTEATLKAVPCEIAKNPLTNRETKTAHRN